MKVRPLADRILVRRVAEEEKTKGGIIIPTAPRKNRRRRGRGGGQRQDRRQRNLATAGREEGRSRAIRQVQRKRHQRSTASIISSCARTTSSASWKVEDKNGSQRDSVRRGRAGADPVRGQSTGRRGQGDAGRAGATWSSRSRGARPRSPRTASRSPRRSSSKINSPTWARRW